MEKLNMISVYFVHLQPFISMLNKTSLATIEPSFLAQRSHIFNLHIKFVSFRLHLFPHFRIVPLVDAFDERHSGNNNIKVQKKKKTNSHLV